MANELFYSVPENKAADFKTKKAADKVIGFVTPTSGDDFGYLVANGTQFGPSKAQIQSMITTSAPKVTVSNTGNTIIGEGGAKYTVSINASGVLSVSKYVATTISARASSVSSTSSTTGTSNSGLQYLGTTYTLKPSITIASGVAQTLSYTINNETGNEWTITGIKYGTSYVVGASASIGQNGIIAGANYSTGTGNGEYVLPSSESAYLLASATPSATTNTVAWAAEKRATASITTKTFDIYLHEKGTSALQKATISLSASVPSVSVSVKAQAYYYTSTSEIKDSALGTATTVTYPTKPDSVTFNAGTPFFAFPAVWGTPTFKQLGATDGAWVLKTTTNLGSPAVSCKIYTHSAIKASGSWSVTWA